MMKKILFIFFVIAMFCITIVCAQEEVTYIIDMPNPANHIFDVTMKFKTSSDNYTVIMMPSCIPGYYKEEYYAKDVQEFSAFDETGAPLKWERAELSAWKIYHKQGQEIDVKYRVFSNSKKIHLSYLNSQRALINPATLCMYIKDKTNLPCNLTVNFPTYWTNATALKRTGKNTFYAPDYNILVDCPIMTGNLKIKKINYKNVCYNIVADSIINFNLKEFADNLEKIIKQEADMMEIAPIKEYYFFVIIYPECKRAIEHANSSVIGVDPEKYGYLDKKGKLKLLLCCAHELFHLWCGKCIYAKNIYPYDYSKPNLTKLYWFFEGFTQYYEKIFAVKAGFINEKEYFKELIKSIEYFENTNSAHHISAENASFAGCYLEPQNFNENFLDFYRKGALAALFIDLNVRHETQNKKSLDDIMRYLYHNYGLKNTGIEEDSLEEIFEKAAGVNLRDIFNSYIRGAAKIDYNKYLDYAGLKLEIKEDEPEIYLGIDGNYKNGKIVVEKIRKNSPAQAARLAVDDIIIAANGLKITNENYLESFKEGDKVALSLFRNSVLMTKYATLSKKGKEEYSVTKIEKPNSLQKEILKSWLGE